MSLNYEYLMIVNPLFQYYDFNLKHLRNGKDSMIVSRI